MVQTRHKARYIAESTREAGETTLPCVVVYPKHRFHNPFWGSGGATKVNAAKQEVVTLMCASVGRPQVSDFEMALAVFFERALALLA